MASPDNIDLRRHIRAFRRMIWLYVLIFLVISGLAIAFICISQPRYDSTALLLIEESNDDSPQKSGLLNMMRAFSSGGGLGRASVDNEILLLSSRDIAAKTVEALQLNVEVSEKKGMSKKLLFENLPIKVELSDGLAKKLSKSIFITASKRNGKWDLRVKEGKWGGKTLAERNDISLPTDITTTYGTISLSENKASEKEDGVEYLITISNPEVTADNLYKNVKVQPRDKMSDVIELTVTDIGKERGGAVLNEMMNQYNIKRLERRKETSLMEIDFLNERIAGISDELNKSEKEVERFKTENNFVDIRSEAPILLETSLDTHKDLLVTSAEIAYYEQVLSILKDGGNEMLPAVAVPGSGENTPNQLIISYNKEVLAKQELEKSALPGNAALDRANQKIENLRNSITQTFSQLLTNAKLTQSKHSGATEAMDGKLKNLPSYEREYVALYRDNMLKNELYSYLVEKRENALLQYYSLSTLGFVIDEAYTEIKPSLKRPAIAISGAVIFTLIIILTLVIVFTKRQQTIDDPMDLAEFGLEANSIHVRNEDFNKAISKVRGWLINDKQPKAIFIANLTDCDFSRPLAQSFENASLPVELLESAKSNDKIISPQTGNLISELLSSGKNVIVDVPEANATDILSSEINATEGRLVLIISSGTISRKELYELTRPFIDDHVFTVVTNR